MKQINRTKMGGNYEYSRRKKDDEMVAATQFEVNECKYITTEQRRKGSWNTSAMT